MVQWSLKYRDRIPLSDETNRIKCVMCVGLHNWLPVNMSAELHGAECGIDLAFVMIVSNQANLSDEDLFMFMFACFRTLQNSHTQAKSTEVAMMILVLC